MMDLREFKDTICNRIVTGWKDGADVEFKETKKNNGVVYTGVYINDEKNSLVPVIYLEDYYPAYLDGVALSDIVDDIRKDYDWAMSRINSFEYDFSEYQVMKDQIIYRLVNYERNEDMLKECPHIRMDDLAVTFRFIAQEDNMGISTCLVTDYELEEWGVGLQDILLDAQRNTRKRFPEKVLQMDRFLADIFMGFPEPKDDLPMFIITNEQQINGASVLLYEDFLKRFSQEHPGDYYVLPSSIHEVIMIPVAKVDDPNELMNIVRQANYLVVDETEFLSASVYYYDSMRNSISNLSSVG